MSERPQFSLKAILVIIAVLSVPLAIMRVSVCGGFLYLFPVLLGSAGYLWGGKRGMHWGVGIALLVTVVLVVSVLATALQ